MRSFKQHLEENKGPCWTGYRQVGMKKKNGKEVPNCVPEETSIDEETTGQLIRRLNMHHNKKS